MVNDTMTKLLENNSSYRLDDILAWTKLPQIGWVLPYYMPRDAAIPHAGAIGIVTGYNDDPYCPSQWPVARVTFDGLYVCYISENLLVKIHVD